MMDTGQVQPGSDRLNKSPLQLVLQAAGGPRDWVEKARALGRVLRNYVDPRPLDRRLERLVELGYMDTVPTRIQLVVGSADMLRFWITPAAADYYASKGINFAFHQVLRFLDDPGSLTDPLGFSSDVDTIIGHVLQVVHANPRYDLQLLDSFPDGVRELERQTQAMIDGTHPRFASLSAVVEDPAYFPRLLQYVREYLEDPTAPPPLRENVSSSAELQVIERTFGTLPAAMRYMARMPTTVRGAIHHLRHVDTFPVELGEPEPTRPRGRAAA